MRARRSSPVRRKGLGWGRWLWGAVVGPRRTKKTRRGWGWGWGWRRNTGGGAGGSAGGPCGVLYGKHSMFLVKKGSRDICSLTADRAGLYVIDRQYNTVISSQFHFPDLYILVMVYPCYVHYDLPSCYVLLLSWFGNKLSI